MVRAERQLAAAICQHAQAFAHAVSRRSAQLGAADRFYKDLVIYQWRLDAVDAQLQAIEQVEEPSDSCPEAFARRCAEASARCERAIEEQREVAVASLEERAAHYAVGVPAASSGRLERFAVKAVDRERATDRLRRLAIDTFEELRAEARATLLGAAAGAAAEDGASPPRLGLAQLRASLVRRRRFWEAQLEETWAAWQDSTGEMHSAGDQVLAEWTRLLAALASASDLAAFGPLASPSWVHRRSSSSSCSVSPFASPSASTTASLVLDDLSELRRTSTLSTSAWSSSVASTPSWPPSLSRALIGALVEALRLFIEVELKQSIGLSGLGGLGGASPEEAEAAASICSAEAREAAFAPTVELLRSLGELHRLGDALLDERWLEGLSASEACGNDGPSASLEAGDEVGGGDEVDDAADSVGAGDDAAPTSVAERWVLEGLVEALCEAAAGNRASRALSLLRLSSSFPAAGASAGGAGAGAARRALLGATSRAPEREGRSAAQLAAERGHEKLAKLLERWAAEAADGGLGFAGGAAFGIGGDDDFLMTPKALADCSFSCSSPNSREQSFGRIGEGTRRAAFKKWLFGDEDDEDEGEDPTSESGALSLAAFLGDADIDRAWEGTADDGSEDLDNDLVMVILSGGDCKRGCSSEIRCHQAGFLPAMLEDEEQRSLCEGFVPAH